LAEFAQGSWAYVHSAGMPVGADDDGSQSHPRVDVGEVFQARRHEGSFAEQAPDGGGEAASSLAAKSWNRPSSWFPFGAAPSNADEASDELPLQPPEPAGTHGEGLSDTKKLKTELEAILLELKGGRPEPVIARNTYARVAKLSAPTSSAWKAGTWAAWESVKQVARQFDGLQTPVMKFGSFVLYPVAKIADPYVVRADPEGYGRKVTCVLAENITRAAESAVAPWAPVHDVQPCIVCDEQLEPGEIHHCRNCCAVTCEDHSRHRRRVPWKGWPSPVRVCDSCVEIVGVRLEILGLHEQIGTLLLDRERGSEIIVPTSQASAATKPPKAKLPGPPPPPKAKRKFGAVPPPPKAKTMLRPNVEDSSGIWSRDEGDWIEVGDDALEALRRFRSSGSRSSASASSAVTAPLLKVFTPPADRDLAILFRGLPETVLLSAQLRRYSLPMPDDSGSLCGRLDPQELMDRLDQLVALLARAPPEACQQLCSIPESDLDRYRLNPEQRAWHLLQVPRLTSAWRIVRFRRTTLVGHADAMKTFHTSTGICKELREACTIGQPMRQLFVVLSEALTRIQAWRRKGLGFEVLSELLLIKAPMVEGGQQAQKNFTLLDWLATQQPRLCRELLENLQLSQKPQVKTIEGSLEFARIITEEVKHIRAEMASSKDCDIAEHELKELAEVAAMSLEELSQGASICLAEGGELLKTLGEEAFPGDMPKLARRVDHCRHVISAFLGNLRGAVAVATCSPSITAGSSVGCFDGITAHSGRSRKSLPDCIDGKSPSGISHDASPAALSCRASRTFGLLPVASGAVSSPRGDSATLCHGDPEVDGS